MRSDESAFTLIEILFVMAIVAIVAAISIPAFESYIGRSRVLESKVQIEVMEKAIREYESRNRKLPDGLGDVNYADKPDPWGRPYEYVNLRNMKGNGAARKDKSLAPLNSDFDLYSVGRDGLTAAQLSNKASRDDVVRARDGRFVGLASDFDP